MHAKNYSPTDRKSVGKLQTALNSADPLAVKIENALSKKPFET